MTFKDNFIDPEGKKFDVMLNDFAGAINYLKTWWADPFPIPETHSTELDEFKKTVTSFSDPFPLNPQSRNAVFTELCERLKSNLRLNVWNMAQQHPTPILESLIASFLVSIQNPNSVYNFVSPPQIRMEKEVISWVSNMIGFPHDQSGGNIVSGGSIANLTALTIARNIAFPDSEGVGFAEAGTPFANIQPGEFSTDFPEKGRSGQGAVLSSPYAHYSIEKACKILGFGSAEAGNYYQVNLDGSLKMDINQLRSDLKRLKDFGKKIVAVVSVFGTTETGLIEPIEDILELRDEYGFFYIVDAAHGGWALSLKALDSSDKYRKKIEEKSRGIEEADAIVVDPHKLGFLHYPAGCIILRDKQNLKRIHQSARYLAGDETFLFNPGSSTIEGSRPGSPAAAIWTAIKTVGMKGYAELIRQCLEMTEYLFTELQKIGSEVEVLNPNPDLNLLCFRIKKGNNHDDATQKICDAINESRKFYIGTTSSLANQHIKAIRMCIMNPHTTTSVIDEFVAELKKRINEFKP